jgi:hypothetical protein
VIHQVPPIVKNKQPILVESVAQYIYINNFHMYSIISKTDAGYNFHTLNEIS